MKDEIHSTPPRTRAVLYAVLLVALITGLKTPVFGGFALGRMLEPVNGLYKTARLADIKISPIIQLEGLIEPVEIIYDHRGVPHIYAQNDHDLSMALGYAVARDRLFELDFLPRAAAGKLAEVLGASAVNTDRHFRSIGLEWAAKKHVDERPIEIDWFQKGANAYISELSESDYPFEMRLLGYEPNLLGPIDALLLQQYLTYDLSYENAGSTTNELRGLLGASEYENLYPRFSRHFVPIVPSEEAHWGIGGDESSTAANTDTDADQERLTIFGIPETDQFDGSIAEGYREGIGSNNWAVSGARSETGFPILAGDMHLNLSLPSIWYEAHMVSPEINVYGVTFPGAPTIVEGITPTTAWAFTNTGSDQIDHYLLEVDSTGQAYRIGDEWEFFTFVTDTIFVAAEDPVVERRLYSRYGPVLFDGARYTAIRWVAHEDSRSIQALLEMGRATSYAAFEEATRGWDSPMQNILFASRSDTIAIRSTGYLPVRSGGDGSGVLDGSTGENVWDSRLPFDELPHAINPAQGFLSSTNQQPADSTYPHYMGDDWRSTHRSLRINELLEGEEQHSVRDIRSYQADVYVVQADQFIPFIEGLDSLSTDAREIQSRLSRWNRQAVVNQVEPTLFRYFLDELEDATWDESVFQNRRKPAVSSLYHLMLSDPQSVWFDNPATSAKETGPQIVREVLEKTASKYARQIRTNPEYLNWGNGRMS